MFVSDFIIFLYLDSVRLPWFFASTKQHDEDRSDSPNFQAQTLIPNFSVTIFYVRSRLFTAVWEIGQGLWDTIHSAGGVKPILCTLGLFVCSLAISFLRGV